MKKRVLYDCDVFIRQSYGGISKQFTELFKDMQRYEPVIAAYNNCGNANLDNYMKSIKYKQDLTKNIYDNVRYSCQAALDDNYDLYHSSYFNLNYLQYVKKPWVCTIHDMALEKDLGNIQNIKEYLKTPNIHPDTKMQMFGKIQMVKFADAIIAVSRHTKEKIIEYLNCDPNKIHVCYPGIDEKLIDMPENIELGKQLENYQYILFVGNRGGYKNFDMFIKEFKKINTKYGLKLICTGRPFDNNEINNIQTLGLASEIIHMTYNDDSEMKTLYKNAKCFVFPSLYEGFGLPIIESFACECPCLLNNTTCFPEIGGDACIYFNMNENENDFMDVFDNFMNMAENEINEYKKKGLERCRHFTFQKFAESVEQVYDDVLKNYELTL